MGHVGGVMAPGDVAVGAEVFEDVAAARAVFADDLAVALHAGVEHHQPFVVVRQVQVVDHGLEEVVATDRRPDPFAILLIAKPGGAAGLVADELATHLRKPDQIRGVG